MAKTKRVIWGNLNLDITQWEDDIREEYPDASDEEIWDRVFEINNGYLDDERANLNIELENSIVIFKDLSLWDGRCHAVDLPRNWDKNISECLRWPEKGCEMVEWYVDSDGDLHCTGVHHDGTNKYTYRVLKRGVSEEDFDEFVECLYDKTKTVDELFNELTESIGKKISAFYG